MKTYTLKTIILFIVIGIYFPVFAQQGDTLFIQRGKSGKIEFARFKKNENSDRKMQNDTTFLKSVLKAKKEDGFSLKSEIIDDLGITHKKFQQYYKGIKVDNAEYLVHGQDDEIEVINGDFQDINVPSEKPKINEKQALSKALEYVGAKKYKWEDLDMENFIRQQENNPYATYYPKGELVFAKDNLKEKDCFKLSWKFTISSLQPDNEQLIFVDATNGEVIRDIPLIMDNNATGSAQTLYSGPQNITCDSYNSGYRLYESRTLPSGGTVIINTKNCANGSNTGSATEFANTTANWTSGNWSTFTQNQAALDAHWAEEKVLDYWSSVFSRNSLNNSGLNITGFVHYYANDGNEWPLNAQWDPTSKTMRYGDGNGGTYGPFVALDIVAHEMGHGICQFTANLTYQGESGAISESLSDIWGACVENWATTNKQTWLCGEDLGTATRSMSNPTDFGQPNTYGGTNWLNPSDLTWDNGGVHRNSGVMNYWFYLLSVGGSITDGIGNTYYITGIGIDKAARIVYRAECDYMTSSTNFANARNATIQAAASIYGIINSQEVISVTNAWYIVGVGDPYPLTITGPVVICSGNIPTYSATNWRSGYYWDKSSNLSLSNTSTYSTKVTGASSSELAWVSVKNSNGVELKKYDIWLGGSAIVYNITGPSSPSPSNYNLYYAQHPSSYDALFNSSLSTSVLTYEWKIDPYAPLSYSPYSNPAVVDFSNSFPGTYYYLSCRVSNGCDISGWVYYGIQVGYQTSSGLIFSPNPASTDVFVEVLDNAGNSSEAASATEPTYTVQITDMSGTPAYNGKKKGKKFNLSVSSLKNGVYNVTVSDGEKTGQGKLIVKH